MGVASIHPHCISSKIYFLDYSFPARLNDAWHLSWTTFSSVGYGVISPRTAAGYIDKMEKYHHGHACPLMSTVLSFECLLGLLYISTAGAIIFGRVTQFQNNAQVKFSSLIIVRYGADAKNVMDGYSSGSSDSSDDEDDDDEIPCPILILRVANLLHCQTRRQIVQANMNAVATVDVKNAMGETTTSDTQHRHALKSIRQKVSPGDNKIPDSWKNVHLQKRFPKPLKKLTSKKRNDFNNFNTPNQSLVRSRSSMLTVDGISDNVHTQNNTANLVFANVPLTPKSHPCFTTVWRVMHELNESSPLISKALRKEIAENGGNWPIRLCNRKAVTDSIDFDQLMVSFTGMSAATGSEVSCSKVYEKENVKVGFQFNGIVTNNNGYSYVNLDDLDQIFEAL